MPLMRRVLFWGKLDRAAPLIDALREIVTAHSATPTQVALAWLITHYGDKPRTCSVTPNSVWSNRLMNATRLSSVGSKGKTLTRTARTTSSSDCVGGVIWSWSSVWTAA
jgi:diketogulonate reductase-like aldo/keto reductase